MKIPLLDLSLQYQQHEAEFKAAMHEVATSAQFILGPWVGDFERAFAKFTGASSCVGVGNGTDALRLGIKALGLGRGDEILLPCHTFIATAIGILEAGCTPKFIDIDEQSFLLDPRHLEAAVTEKTKAICPVHLYGRACEMNTLVDFARRHNLRIIEDAAQAHGAKWNNEHVGTIGDVGAFSFYPGKNLGAFGDGGCLVTNNVKIDVRLRQLRNYGSDIKYYHPEKGGNSRLDSLQAAILSIKLKYLAAWNQKRWLLAERYNELLLPLAREGRVVLPELCTPEQHVFHLYVIRVPRRDLVLSFLHEHGIGAGIHYPIPIHLQQGYVDLGYKAGDFPVTERVSQEIISLPLFPEMTHQQQDEVVNCLRKIL